MVVLSLGVAPKPISGWQRDVCWSWAVTIAPSAQNCKQLNAVALNIPVSSRSMDVQPPQYFAGPSSRVQTRSTLLVEVEPPKVGRIRFG